MLTEFRKSINAILYERTTSPLWGTLLFSWTIWNWKIIYLTFIISEGKIQQNKIDYIISNYNDWAVLFLYPFLSTIFILVAVPLLSNGAFWLSLIYEKWRLKKKMEIENKVPLTIEKSIQLRAEVRNQEERFEKLLDSKEKELEQLRNEVKTYRGQLSSLNKNVDELPKATAEEIYQKQYEDLKSNGPLFEEFKKVGLRAQRGTAMFIENDPKPINREMLDYFLANNLVEKVPGKTIYTFTEKGKFFYKLVLEEKLYQKK